MCSLFNIEFGFKLDKRFIQKSDLSHNSDKSEIKHGKLFWLVFIFSEEYRLWIHIFLILKLYFPEDI